MNIYRKNPELHEKIISLYNQGYLDPQIGEKLNIPRRTICYIRNKILGLANLRNGYYIFGSKNFKDLLEKSNLELISKEFIQKDAKHKFYKVKCKNCGKEFEKSISTIGKQKCQCVKKEKPSHNSISYKLISSTYFKRCEKGAKQRNLEFSVNYIDLWNQWEKQEFKCALSGMELIIKRNYRERHEMTASLDRIDSSMGYTKENIQWIHKDINKMKNNYSDEYFISICKLIANNNKK